MTPKAIGTQLVIDSSAVAPNVRSRSVIVVGGGLAGIAASLALRRRGFAVQLIEARRRLGGRVGSFVDPVTEASVDYCQHVAMGCCKGFRQLIQWLDQEEHWEVHRQLHFYGPQGQYQRLSGIPVLPAPFHLAGWLLKWPGLTLSDRITIARGMLAIRAIQINSNSDDLIADTWLRKIRQSAGAIENFWRTIIVSALGEELHRVSLSAMAKVLQDGFLNDRQAYQLWIPKLPLGQLFGAMTETVLAARGVQTLLGTKVRCITSGDNEKVTVELSNQDHLQADALVIAVPWFRIAGLIPDSSNVTLLQIAKNAGKIESSPISGIHTWWDRPWLDTPHATIVGRLAQWVFSRPSEQTGPVDSHYYQVVISASRGLPGGSDEILKRQLHEDLAFVFPKVRSARLLRIQAVTDPQSVFSLTPQCARLRPKSHVVGTRIWLAGDWVSTGWPATMESAVLSGMLAAEDIFSKYQADTLPNYGR
jgi:squalene-associated FAD-dependent desaturase